jgi:hypothetical protein
MVHEHGGEASEIDSEFLLFFQNHEVIFLDEKEPEELSELR